MKKIIKIIKISLMLLILSSICYAQFTEQDYLDALNNQNCGTEDYYS